MVGWQSPGFNGKLWHGILPLTGMWPDDFVYFSVYALSKLMLMLSTFFFMLFEHYGLQLQHVSPHSIMLVAIFMHLCKMYVCMHPLVHLFCCFYVLRFARRSSTPIGSYYFQHRAKGLSKYIAALRPGKWDGWREDWLFAQGDAQDRLELPTPMPTVIGSTRCNTHFLRIKILSK
jgi:hypothetical protein